MNGLHHHFGGPCHATQHALNAAWTNGWETDSTVCGVDVSDVSKASDLGGDVFTVQ